MWKGQLTCCYVRTILNAFAALQTKGRYHVRVLVPCYRESLEIVARTCQAAWNAKLPVGCDRTIYLCDDGKEASKRKW